AKSFSEGLAAVQKSIDKKQYAIGKWGFINTEFEEATDFAFEDARSFSNGMAAVCNSKDNGKWGFTDTNGNLVIDFSYENALGFSKSIDGIILAAVQKNGHWGFIDKSGNEVIEYKYEKV